MQNKSEPKYMTSPIPIPILMSLEDLFKKVDFIPTTIRSIPIIINAEDDRKISEYNPSSCESININIDIPIHAIPTTIWKNLIHFGLIISPDDLILTPCISVISKFLL